MSDVTLGQIKTAFPNLNLSWVLLGQGEMLLSESNASNDTMRQDPDYKEILQMIERIGDENLAISIQNKLFELYQNNSDLKTELLSAYKMVRNT